MKINANSIRAGNVLEHNGRLYIVSKTPDHTMPGKGGAFVQVEMKDIKNGTKINERFRSTENAERVRLDQKEYQFLFIENNQLNLMDIENFEQITINEELIGDKIAYLQDGMVVTVEMYEESPLKILLPDTVVLNVIETEPVVKGQTAASSYKPAILENGVRIMVPPFIDPDTKVVVKTEDDTYVERYKI
jgi:elongation factor P